MTSDLIVEAIRSITSTPINDNTMSPAGVSAAANPDAVARFQAAMGTDAVNNVQQTEDIPLVGQISETWRSAQVDHQGLLHRIKALTELNGEHALSAAELSELQYDVATLAFQQEVVSKVADKASNAIQTLIKNQ